MCLEPGTEPTGTDLYASFTPQGGWNTLRYPDRKFLLLGKDVRPEFLADLTVG